MNEGRRDTSLTVRNTGGDAFLAQSWLQSGVSDDAPETLELWVTPPVVRIDPNREALVRIVPLDIAKLPKEQESVFYLNVQQVPENKADIQNKLVLAIRQRLKVFYRPSGLKGTSEDAPKQLVWRVEAATDGGYTVFLRNPSVYHVNFAGVSLLREKQSIADHDAFMLKPLESREIHIDRKINVGASIADTIRFSTINDFGAEDVQAHSLPNPSSAQ
ncbi:molecular chaperone [Burkholderiaceae bacterium DAT-1]|nr:molecular chaperone [Burkholderiaceae bacterium DAT-1]